MARASYAKLTVMTEALFTNYLEELRAAKHDLETLAKQQQVNPFEGFTPATEPDEASDEVFLSWLREQRVQGG